MDYSKMSDQEINMAVAEIIFPDRPVVESKSRPPCACVTGHPPSQWVDYCNNPADAWPIIVNNLIALRPVALYVGGHRWFATQGEGDFGMKYADDNPLRSAMIVFLMMQESANVQDNPAR